MKDALDESCVFCAIAQRAAPADIVYQTDAVVAFVPNNPATPAHTLVSPRRHVTDFLAADVATFTAVTTAALRVARAVRQVVAPEGANLITSAGAAATQTVRHLHLHVVPRWHGDPMGTIWPPRGKGAVAPGHRLDFLEQIRHACETVALPGEGEL